MDDHGMLKHVPKPVIHATNYSLRQDGDMYGALRPIEPSTGSELIYKSTGSSESTVQRHTPTPSTIDHCPLIDPIPTFV